MVGKPGLGIGPFSDYPKRIGDPAESNRSICDVGWKPYGDRFAFLMVSMAMRYVDTASISTPSANATPSNNITIFSFTHRVMDTL